MREFWVTQTSLEQRERSESSLALTNDQASKLFYDNSILMSAPPLTQSWTKHYTRPGSSIVHNYCRVFSSLFSQELLKAMLLPKNYHTVAEIYVWCLFMTVRGDFDIKIKLNWSKKSFDAEKIQLNLLCPYIT